MRRAFHALPFLAAALTCLGQEISLQNGGRYGPVPQDPGALRLAEEQLTVQLGRSSSTVQGKSRFVGLKAGKQAILFPDLAAGWRDFEAEQEHLPPEKRVKWSDPDNPFVLFPYSPARNALKQGGDFSGLLEDVEIRVNGRRVPPEDVVMRVAVSSVSTWAFPKGDRGFPMVWRRIYVDAAPDRDVVVEWTYRARNTTYLAGAEVNLFDYEVIAGRGAAPVTFSLIIELAEGLTQDHLKWQGLRQTDRCHMTPGRDAWTAINDRMMRLFWSRPYGDPGKNLVRLALDNEWVNAPPEGAPVHSSAFRLVKILKTAKDEPPALDVTREYFLQTFRVIVLPTAAVSEQDLKRLRARKIKPGTTLEIQGLRVKPDEIAVKDGGVFVIK